ncbi:unnamed protein product [Arctogadus glacialis]
MRPPVRPSQPACRSTENCRRAGGFGLPQKQDIWGDLSLLSVLSLPLVAVSPSAWACSRVPPEEWQNAKPLTPVPLLCDTRTRIRKHRCKLTCTHRQTQGRTHRQQLVSGLL